jgi:protein-L-isoaspartate O-methyltransferase
VIPDRPASRGRGRSVVRGWLYDRLLSGLTASWYHAVLTRLPDRARVLDVGIGTGGAVARCAELVRAKDLRIVGVDIDRDYLERCVSGMSRAGLDEHVSPCLASVYDHRGGPYDAVYFSASLMLLPDPVGALTHVASQLEPTGQMFFTQTFHHRRSRLLEKLKPMAHRVTTIHFGRVTYEDEFRAALVDAGLELVEFVPLKSTRHASACLAVACVQGREQGDLVPFAA